MAQQDKSIPIDVLIHQLQKEREQGAKTVFYHGTVYTDNGNSIVITTEPQM